ncbi:MAG TPA: ATP-binding cassette domain-containing protein [Acidimicrobiales bacterium]|nr:ATP-binding cassette domain-containing protein [Acidimicrobiales bacterium]
MPASELAVRCHGLSVDYPTRATVVHALRDVDAAFGHRRLGVVAGPSGSGKSSLLRVLAGLQRPTGGRLEIDGTDVTSLRAGPLRRLRRRAMGIVLQDPADNLVEYLPAVEQVELAARLRGVDPGGAAALLDVVGLADRAGSYPHELSGGEQQRVAFAAAAIGTPTLLLADEPTAELDAAAGDTVVETMRHLVEHGATLVVASHDPAVVEAAQDVVTLRDGQVVAA